MVEICCRTNIDCCKRLEWPDRLPEAPRVGDLIRSTSSTKDKYIELRVCRCTWVYTPDQPYLRRAGWILELDLHMPEHRFENLTAFERWVTGRAD